MRSIGLSAPESKVLHGITVRKLPILPYFQAMDALSRFKKQKATTEGVTALIERLIGVKKGRLKNLDAAELFEVLEAWKRLNGFEGAAKKGEACRSLDENDESWLQRCIAKGLMMGIGKRALLYDFYPDEFFQVLKEWNALHGIEETETVNAATPNEFFG